MSEYSNLHLSVRNLPNSLGVLLGGSSESESLFPVWLFIVRLDRETKLSYIFFSLHYMSVSHHCDSVIANKTDQNNISGHVIVRYCCHMFLTLHMINQSTIASTSMSA